MSIDPKTYIGTAEITDQLTDQELAALYMVIMQDGDLTRVPGYEKAKGLFPGGKMHVEVKAVLDIAAKRLNR